MVQPRWRIQEPQSSMATGSGPRTTERPEAVSSVSPGWSWSWRATRTDGGGAGPWGRRANVRPTSWFSSALMLAVKPS